MSGIGFKRNWGTEGIPVFQGTGKDIQLAQGGFLLDTTGLSGGVILPAGTPMIFDESTRKAKPIITGKVFESASTDATSYKIEKGSSLKEGDNFAAKVGDKAYPVTAIDKTNAAYDVVTVGTTIGAVTAGSMVFASSTTGATNSAFGDVNGLLYRDQIVAENESCSVVIRGTVYARRVPYSADLEAALPELIYSQSY